MNRLLVAAVCGWALAGVSPVNAQSYVELAPWNPPDREDPPSVSSLINGAPSADKSVEGALAVEGASAVDGSSYTVVAPTFMGGIESGNNVSFVRFPNAGEVEATIIVDVVGSPSGEVYGRAHTIVAPLASPQFSVQTILDAIGVEGFQFGDDSISLYLRSPQGGQLVGFQHVIWSSDTGFFENLSICTYRFDIDYSPLNQALVNVHTSTIPSYPGIIIMHNYASFPVTYRADIYDANDGAYLGAVNFFMIANHTISMDFAAVESVLDFVPTSDQFHVNIVFTAQNTGGEYYGIAGQGINNLQLNAFTNMSSACAINPSFD
jgi:hypothetical protein